MYDWILADEVDIIPLFVNSAGVIDTVRVERRRGPEMAVLRMRSDGSITLSGRALVCPDHPDYDGYLAIIDLLL